MAWKSTTTSLILFTDFDGTVSTQDVGNRLFHHFSQGRSDDPVERWKRNEIDSRQCLLDEAAAMRDITEDELFAFIDGFAIDPTFPAFVTWARSWQIPLYVLSDGLDIYIRRLLASHGLGDLDIYANTAALENGRFRFSFPYLEGSCGQCANCKGSHIRNLRTPGSRAVYIGDGKSDLCALPEADMVFAKDFLAEHCLREGIEFLPFDDFSGITDMLTGSVG